MRFDSKLLSPRNGDANRNANYFSAAACKSTASRSTAKSIERVLQADLVQTEFVQSPKIDPRTIGLDNAAGFKIFFDVSFYVSQTLTSEFA